MPIRAHNPLRLRKSTQRLAVAIMLASSALIPSAFVSLAQPAPDPAADTAQPLDRVIAVVNTQVILASDLDLEMRIVHLLPSTDNSAVTEAQALDRLTTRALIEQQILQEDPHGLEVNPKEVAANLIELRQNTPACKRHDCASPSGWAAYLATLGLTTERLNEYWASRMAVLAFIERRFRSGIRIPPEDIEKYYRETLTPQYPTPSDVPPLDRVSSRIQELLLQQRVTALLNDWLKSLQDQGQVEILDPELAAATAESAENGGVN
jgi:peptidyl-prolyl cis-trans isomerase SurA